MRRAVKRGLTAVAEHGVARVGIAAVRALDHDVIGQAHNPHGAAGRVIAWEMAHRPPIVTGGWSRFLRRG